MIRFLLDTGIAGDFVNRRRGVYERAREELQRGNRIGICTPVLGELWFGAELSQSRERNTQLLRRNLSGLVVWPYDTEAAEAFGRIAADLRRRGRPIQQIDMQIAAIALSLGKTVVVSADNDLSTIPELDVVNWAQLESD